LHIFKNSLELGKTGEAQLDDFFIKKGWSIEYVTLEQERKRGVDRIIILPDKSRITVEYKTDIKTTKTGNVFLETLSNSKTGKEGWLKTSQAQWLIYYRMDVKLAALFNLADLKLLDYSSYSVKKAINDGYYSEGIIVPWKDFITKSIEVYQL
jgi:hypothetical protein